MVKKQDKIYEEYKIDFSLKEKSRKELKDKAILKFLTEKPGYWKDGKKHVTRFEYFVEKSKDGRRVYLKRPTHLNKGIDFQVWVEKLDGKEDKRPRHSDIFDDLEIKKKENSKDILNLLKAIECIWNCEEPDEVLVNLKMNFEKGLPVDLLLKILKWLFIEQDITYWNYDGRTMLKMAIDENIKKQTLI